MYTSLAIHGLRGFANLQTIDLAVPSGREGSGLTVFVGANNAGKSTVIEGLRALQQTNPPSFTQGRRNKRAGDQIKLELTNSDGATITLESQNPGTSETKRTPEGIALNDLFILPSRRVFPPYFAKASATRDNYMQQIGFPVIRASSLDHFTARLFEIQKNRAEFDAVMSRVIDPAPSWTIDQEDSGQYYLKLNRNGIVHSSEGLGEGLVSLIYIVDALYDSKPGDCIAIDEPELSLHPALQRKLATLLRSYSSDRQIVIASHSSYFVDLHALAHGAKIARISIEDDSSRVSVLSTETASRIAGLLSDQNNPHVLGINAQEVFFLDDKVILVEGQEDVVFLARVEEALGIKLDGEVFGWGVGGADKMELIAQVLTDLRFKSVVGVLDANKADVAAVLSDKFPSYHFVAIPADDIRTKPARKETPEVKGLLDDKNRSIREEYVDATKALFEAANAYLDHV